jgi:membrane-bound lytic murein transglycosylase D
LLSFENKKLLQLNPGFKQPDASLQRAFKIVLPIENVVDFTENLASATQNMPYRPQIRWVHYKVKTGDTLASIANKFQTTPKAIRQLNRLTKNTVRHGNHLLIPNASTGMVAEKEEVKPGFVNTVKNKVKPVLSFNKRTALYIMQPGDTIYMVRKKDSLASIAKRFGINGQSIMTANRLKASLVVPGTQLVIPTHRSNDSKSAKSLQPGDTV